VNVATGVRRLHDWLIQARLTDATATRRSPRLRDVLVATASPTNGDGSRVVEGGAA
jgi:hypothetical protein